MTKHLRDDDGVATVLACICGLALVAVTTLVIQLGAAVVARHRAESAADLGALAGAGVVLDGAAAACAEAARLVAANAASLDDCTVEGADVVVMVSVAVRVGPLRGTAAGRARAGPVADQAE